MIGIRVASAGVCVGLLTGVTAVAPPANANGNCITWFAGRGTGTTLDPYLVSSADDLSEVRFCRDKAFSQTTDIALTGTWTPLGASGGAATSFSGVYDGNNFRITGLLTTDVTLAEVGLFGRTSSATIRETHVSGSIVGANLVGGLIGDAVNTSIVDSSAAVTIVAGDPADPGTLVDIGGLVGAANGSTITTSRASGNISRQTGISTGNRFGGLVGFADGCTISASSASGTVSGNVRVGGLVGNVNGGSLSTSFATGAVTATGLAAGGLVGNLAGNGAAPNNASDVYARGTVTSTSSSVGALIGEYTGGSGSGTRLRGYATGLTTGSTAIGGFVGAATGNPNWTAGYWDTETTGRSNAAGSGSPTGLTGQTTTAMKNIDTYIAGGWSISTTWSASGSTWGICSSVNDGYPYLQATYTSDPCPRAGTPSPTVFTLALDANGGVCTSTSVSGDSGTWVALPAATACTREGFTLAAWSTSRTGGGITLAPGGFTLLTDNNSLYAIWQKNTGPITPTQQTAASSLIRFENLSLTRSGPRERRVTVRGVIRGLAPGQSVQCWFRTSRSAGFTPENVQVTQPGGTFVWTHAARRQLSAYCVAPDGTRSDLLRI